MSRVVLSADDIARSLKRISHEIAESLSNSPKLVILGIPTRGVHLARRIAETLSDISPQTQVSFGVLDVTMLSLIHI